AHREGPDRRDHPSGPKLKASWYKPVSYHALTGTASLGQSTSSTTARSNVVNGVLMAHAHAGLGRLLGNNGQLPLLSAELAPLAGQCGGVRHTIGSCGRLKRPNRFKTVEALQRLPYAVLTSRLFSSSAMACNFTKPAA